MVAAIIDDKTGRGYPLPHGDNPLRRDVGRIRDALSAIDVDVTKAAGDAVEALKPAAVGKRGRVALATPGDLAAGTEGPVPDALVVRNFVAAAVEALKGGVDANADTLAELAALIRNIDVSGPIGDAMAALRGDVPTARNTLRKLSDALNAVVGTADAAHDTLGELAGLLDASTAATGAALAKRLSAEADQTFSVPEKRKLLANLSLRIGTCDARLVFDTANNLKLYSADGGDQVFINGRFITVPAAGINLAPNSTAAATLYQVYLKEDGTLAFSTDAANRGVYGYKVRLADETQRLVGWAYTSNTGQWQDLFVVSNYHRIEREVYGPYANPSTSSTAYVDAGGQMRLLVAAGDRVEYGFRGYGFNYAGAAGNYIEANAYLTLNGSEYGAPQASRAGSNQNTFSQTMVCWNNGTANSVQLPYGRIVFASSNSGTGCALSVTPYMIVRQ